MTIPTVTQLIAPYVDSIWFLPEHAERGQLVHAACLSHIQGLWVPPLLSEYQPYFDSFKKWADIAIDKVLLVEERLTDPVLGFSGRPDLICIIRGDEFPTLIDLKTSQAEQRSWAIQIAAYRHLALVDREINTVRGISVRLKADGGKAICMDYPKNYKNELNIFLGLLNAHRFFNK